MKQIGVFFVVVLYINGAISGKLRIRRQTEAPVTEANNSEATSLDEKKNRQNLPPCPSNPNEIIFPEDPRFSNSSFLCNPPSTTESSAPSTTVAPMTTSAAITTTPLVTKSLNSTVVSSSTLITTESINTDTSSVINVTPPHMITETLSLDTDNQSLTISPDLISSTTMNPQEECILRCPVTTEYNPVCGSNLVTYLNPGRLICARTCGVGVDLRGTGPCPSSTTTTTALIDPASEADNGLVECLIRCPSTPEYNPVCGSNLITYINAGRLVCAQTCGVQVTLQRRGPCPISPIQSPLLPRNQDIEYIDDFSTLEKTN